MPRKTPDAAPRAASPDAKATRRPTAELTATIEAFGLEAILDLVEDGKTHVEIAEEVGVDRRTLRRWLDDDDARRRAVQRAFEDSAAEDDRRALRVISDLDKDATPALIARAREMASHYRWRAKARNQKVYGDKQELTVKDAPSTMSDEDLDAEIAKRTAKVQPAARLQ
jgi:predicted transcriptional regulator